MSFRVIFQRAELFQNPNALPRSGAQNHWLGIKLVGTTSNRDAIGARITYQAQELKQSRMKVGVAVIFRAMIRAWSLVSASARSWIGLKSNGRCLAVKLSALRICPSTVTSRLSKAKANGRKLDQSDPHCRVRTTIASKPDAP